MWHHGETTLKDHTLHLYPWDWLFYFRDRSPALKVAVM